MSRHTVGPWEYDAESGEVYAPKCGYQWQAGAPVIARVEPQDYGEGGANGALIAAAPLLSAALEPFVLQNSSDEFLTITVRTSDVSRARAALAAAKGEA